MAFDDSLTLLREGYTFISKRCDALGVDAFETRLLLRKTICMRGEEAAQLITDPKRFSRKKAAPRRIIDTLFGFGGVQGLDGAAHHHRKAMFVDLMSPQRIDALVQSFRQILENELPRWVAAREVVLFDALQTLICRAVCSWAGVPLDPWDVDLRTHQMAATIETGGRLGPQHWKGRLARKRAERWIAGIILEVRRGRLIPPRESALSVIAGYRGLDGKRLPLQVAAVELLNVLRPTIAVARFMAFEVVALERYPEWRKHIRNNGDSEPFIQEVRRTTPFFPFIAARPTVPFRWRGLEFTRSKRVLLDLYGTDHDRRLWPQPTAFDPNRFVTREPTAYDLIPQGAGEHRAHHRCAGEWVTIALMKTFAEIMCRDVEYTLPAQDLTVDLSRMPALPRSHVVIRDVHERKPINVRETSRPSRASSNQARA